MFRRRIFYILIAAAILIGGLYFLSKGVNESADSTQDIPEDIQKEQEKDINDDIPIDNSAITNIIPLDGEVDEDLMFETVRYLSEEPRVAGTAGEKRAVDYIENQFNSLGYETELQPFPVVHYEERKAELSINDQSIVGDMRAFLGNEVSGKVSAELVYVGKAESRGDLDEEIEGKIALMEHGAIPPYIKISNILKKGAIGAIMYNDKPSGSVEVTFMDGQQFPAISITRDQGLELLEMVENGSVNATLDVEVESVENTSYNVIAKKKPKADEATEQIVTIGAHHDSVPGSPGANDDASGVAVVLELARLLSTEEIDTEIRFLTFGAEEFGLIGSTFYVNQLPQEEKTNIISHFQLDMVGATTAGEGKPAGGLMMYTMDGGKNIVTDLAAGASEMVFSESISFGNSGRSDHVPFYLAGIPAALFIHTPLEPHYHQPTDTIDKISKEKLEQVAEIMALALSTIVSPDTPAIFRNKEIPVFTEYEYEERGL